MRRNHLHLPLLAIGVSLLVGHVVTAGRVGPMGVYRANDATGADEFGRAVDIDGNYAAIGAPGDDPGGAVYIFDVTTGQQVNKLALPAAEEGTAFGWSVEINESSVLAGTPFAESRTWSDPNGPGTAFLYDALSGVQRAELKSNDSHFGDLFGWSVALEGPWAIVGAPRHNGTASLAGAAYLFDLRTGLQTFKLTGSDTARQDAFGVDVDISGDLAVVGALWHDDGAESTGAAYVFDVTTGEQISRMVTSDRARGDRLGMSVAIEGDRVLVGAYADDDDGKSSGSAYLFDAHSGETLFKFTAEDAALEDHFGWTVDMSGGIGAIGAITDPNQGLLRGKAYLFDLTKGTQLAKLVPDISHPFDRFGSAVAIDGRVTLAGTPELAIGDLSDPAAAAGRVYVFDAVPEPHGIMLAVIGSVLSAGIVSGNRRRDT